MKTQQSQINKWQLLYKAVLFFSTYLQISDANSQSITLKAGVPLNIPIDLTKLIETNGFSNVVIKYSPKLTNSELKLYPYLMDNYIQGQQLKEYQLLATTKNQTELLSKGVQLLNEDLKTTFFADGLLKWKYLVGSYFTASPAISYDGTIYVASNDCYLYAIYTNGLLKWKYQFVSHIGSSPVIGNDNIIYIGSYDYNLYSIYPNGALNWKYQTGNYISSSPAVGGDGVIYVGSWDYCLYAVYPNGTLKWKYQTDNNIFSSPTIGRNGMIYVGSNDYYIYSINIEGTLKWKYQTNGEIISSPAIGSDGTIYVGSNDNYLYAIHINGTLKWKYQTGSHISSSPAITNYGKIYIGSWDDYLYAIHPNGTLEWKYQTASHIYYSSPAIGSDGTIYVGSRDHYLYAIYHNGFLKWKYQTNSYIFASPVIDSDGTIYLAAYDQYLYAISTKTFSNVSPWPQFHQNSLHTGIQPIQQQLRLFDMRYLILEGIPNITGIINIEAIVNRSIVYVTLNFSASVASMPILTNNKLIIRNGKTLVLTTKNFNTSNLDGDYDDLLYRIIALRHGWFTYINNSKAEILSFSQRNIIDGLIQFNHDGSQFAPHYNVTVSSGTLTTLSMAAQVVFDPAPILINNLLIVGQGQSVVLNSDILKASYPDDYTTDFSLNFIISDLQHGYFESTIKPGISITNFTQRELSEGKIKFTHDGSDFAPFCKVAIADDSITTAPVSTNITFIRSPLITNNFLIINQGEALIINNNMLSGSSEQTNDDSALIFTISEIKYGHFELIINPGVAITIFNQQQINGGQILFVHDGTDNAPSYKVTVSDKNLTGKAKEATVRFNARSNNTANIAAILGGTIGGSLASLAIAGVGVFFYKKIHSVSNLNQSERTLIPLVSIENDAPITNEQVSPTLIEQANETDFALSQNLQLNQEQQLSPDDKANKIKSIKNVLQHRKTLSL